MTHNDNSTDVSSDKRQSFSSSTFSTVTVDNQIARSTKIITIQIDEICVRGSFMEKAEKLTG
jgi:hypothetical protein